MTDSSAGGYTEATNSLGQLGAALEHIIREVLDARGIRVHSVVHRVKTELSTQRKLQKSEVNRAPAALHDLLGLRIITYFRDEVDQAAKIIEEEFSIDAPNSVDKRAILDPDRFGYLSVHYVCMLAEDRAGLTEYRRFSGQVFEVQIRSILQHAWAEIEHDLGYKSEAAIPRAVRRRFSRLAGLLEVADDEFVAIRSDLEAHQHEASEEVARGEWDIPIDRDSLMAFVLVSDRVKELDQHLVDVAQGTLEEPTLEYAAEHAAEAAAAGFLTIAELDAFLRENESLLKEFSRRYLLDDYPGAVDAPVIGSYVRKRGRAIHYAFFLRVAQLARVDQRAAARALMLTRSPSSPTELLSALQASEGAKPA